MNLNEIPTWPQRQDSVAEQLADLKIIATKLGLYDAADAIGQQYKNRLERLELENSKLREVLRQYIDAGCGGGTNFANQALALRNAMDILDM